MLTLTISEIFRSLSWPISDNFLFDPTLEMRVGGGKIFGLNKDNLDLNHHGKKYQVSKPKPFYQMCLDKKLGIYLFYPNLEMGAARVKCFV